MMSRHARRDPIEQSSGVATDGAPDEDFRRSIRDGAWLTRMVEIDITCRDCSGVSLYERESKGVGVPSSSTRETILECPECGYRRRKYLRT